MPWQMLWPDFLKKRLCRYLLQHYLGHFFKEKISLEQLSIDIYNGTGCVKNLNLDCDALNEQINSLASLSTANSTNNDLSLVPIEIVSGFVGYISVYIPWHDLFNDYCKLTIKNVQITIRTKQRKPSEDHNLLSSKKKLNKEKTNSNINHNNSIYDSNENDSDDDTSNNLNDLNNSNSMFSSMFIDSIMNTSMNIAHECLYDQTDDIETNPSSDFGDSASNNNKAKDTNSLLGLEAFASTIDSILSRIKINLEQIQIRIENLDTVSSFNIISNAHNIADNSAFINNKPLNGIALELRIKSVKYFDLDSISSTNNTSNGKSNNSATTSNQNNPTAQNTLIRNTTKSFNIEGLTVYFDEFIIKDYDLNKYDSNLLEDETQSYLETKNLNIDNVGLENVSNLDLGAEEKISYSDKEQQQPQDESPLFNFKLNSDYYLYTNPIICLTFTGIQTIKLTINNMRPTDMILEAASDMDQNQNQMIQQQQRPLLEMNAQFGSIKCLLCPKQIHLLIEMFTKLNEYIEDAKFSKKVFKNTQLHRKRYHSKSKLISSTASNNQGEKLLLKNKPIRGCDKKKFEDLVQNDVLNYNSNTNSLKDNENIKDLVSDDDYDNYKSIPISDNITESSTMFYSMMSESQSPHSFKNNSINSKLLEQNSFSKQEPTNFQETGNQDHNNDNAKISAELNKAIERLQNDTIVANVSSNNHNLFQTFKVTFRMFSLTVLHHDPPDVAHDEKNKINETNAQFSSGLIDRLIVNRMKKISDLYFDSVSTIDILISSTSSTNSSTASIDKGTFMKYHQACAFHDHFLVLLKPINIAVIQKINQHNSNLMGEINTNKQDNSYIPFHHKKISSVQYSFNDVSVTIGSIQINEYLVSEQNSEINESPLKAKSNQPRRNINFQMAEAAKNSLIIEIIHFSDNNTATQTSSMQLIEPCFKLQFITYEPLDSNNSKRNNFKSNSNLDATNLLNNNFENIVIQLNKCLICELDISIIDRLYYMINDVTKTKNVSCFENNKSKSTCTNQLKSDEPSNKKLINFTITCNQTIKMALRFPIADLRRSNQANINKADLSEKSKPTATTSSFYNQNLIDSTTSKLHSDLTSLNILNKKPITMIKFRNLREQILTLHLFDFQFQTILNGLNLTNYNKPSELILSFISSQVNAYYQYSKKDRPIHFGLIQQKENESKSVLCSIKIPLNSETNLTEANNDSKLLNNLEAFDSLKENYNIKVGKANGFFYNQTIQEENENVNQNEAYNNSENIRNNDDESDDDGSYGPFSRIHSLISSEKNRRIVNAGNKSEMQIFINQSRQNSKTEITLNLPQLKVLIADQKFLNDIYNCLLNDLIMWMPSSLPPIESSYSFCDIQNQTNIGFGISPNLNYFIDSDHLLSNIRFKAYDDSKESDSSDKKFQMCKSISTLTISDEENSEKSDVDCESDDDNSKRKYKEKLKRLNDKNREMLKDATMKNSNNNSLCFLLNIQKGHLKAFVLNNLRPEIYSNDNLNNLKYGEFDIKADNFQMCIATSETLKINDLEYVLKENMSHKKISDLNPSEKFYKIEKQHICLFTDHINIAHSTKTCPANVTQLKYPTNFASFESLFQMSKTNDLITPIDPLITKTLFNQNTETLSSNSNSQNTNKESNITPSSISIPMISIGIKSKHNLKTNTKQLLVALNFNNLNLNHMFSLQQDYWIFQLILLFDLIDIEIIGYDAPIVLTELHMNVANSCIVYNPLYLSSRSVIPFKSLHFSSNVTAESSLTLLVFNIEDIYLFLSDSKYEDDLPADYSSGQINLKKDYVCVANSYLFELRLLISDDTKKENNANLKNIKVPLLDIKLRSNLIQVRTCVDSTFALIELINYIVSDGDLHQINPIMSEFMMNNANINSIPVHGIHNASSSSHDLQPKQTSQSINVAEQLNNAIENETNSDQVLTKPKISSSIPIQSASNTTATFIIGTPPASSFKSSSSSASFNQQFYSPIKNASMFSASYQDNYQMLNHYQKTYQQSIVAPLPSPSLSFNFKQQQQHNISSSSADSLISDMVKEAITANPMTQSIIGSLDADCDIRKQEQENNKACTKFNLINVNNQAANRKRNASLTLPFFDIQTEESLGVEKNDSKPISNFGLFKQDLRFTSHAEENSSNSDHSLLNESIDNSITETFQDKEFNKEKDLLKSESDKFDLDKESFIIKESLQEEKKLDRILNQNLQGEQNKFNNSDDNDDDDEDLIRSIDKSHKGLLENKNSYDKDAAESNKTSNYNNEYNLKNSDDVDFQFDLPFTDLSPTPLSSNPNNNKNKMSLTNTPTRTSFKTLTSYDINNENSKDFQTSCQHQSEKNIRRLYFKSNLEDEENQDYNFNNEDEDDNDENDDELLNDFDIIDVISGFGEPPKNNQEFEIKVIKNKDKNGPSKFKSSKSAKTEASNSFIEIKEDHFKKPLTKIDVLKAPDSYPVPLNVYCVQEISINWCLYGGSDFGSSNDYLNDSYQSNQLSSNKMNRTVSSPIIVNNSTNTTKTVSNYTNSPSSAIYLATRSRNNSTSSNSLSISPNSFSQQHYQSPPKQQLSTTPQVSSSASSAPLVRFSNKTSSINFSKEKCLPRKAGGRIFNKYDTNSLSWLAKGGKGRNLDECMEIALHKIKTKIDLYSDLNSNDTACEQQIESKEKRIDRNESSEESPYLYRVALAIGDIEIRDKLASSAFNMFLFRYESDNCPKHTNSNMIFLKFLCSKSMDEQRLLECDIKLSIQPLRFNIDQDALIFLVEFFNKLGSKDLNQFKKILIASSVLPQTGRNQSLSDQESLFIQPSLTAQNVDPSGLQTQQSSQQIYIKNFIFSPDLLIRFDFSGKYDKRPDNIMKMDTITKLLMVALQLSNTEIKLKRICYRRGFLGAEKLINAVFREWLSDIQRNQMKNLIKGWGIFNSLIQFFEGFSYLIWYPIEQYRKDGRVLCGIQKGSAAFSTCTILATIELTNRMFQATKNVAEFFYDLVTPHRANTHHFAALGYDVYNNNNSNILVETILTGVGNNRNIKLRRQPNDIREGLTNAYYVMYEGINDTAANLIQEINQGAEHKGIPGAIGGALRQLPSTTLAPIVLTAEATCNILSGIRNQLKPDEKKDDDQKWKVAFNSK